MHFFTDPNFLLALLAIAVLFIVYGIRQCLHERKVLRRRSAVARKQELIRAFIATREGIERGRIHLPVTNKELSDLIESHIRDYLVVSESLYREGPPENILKDSYIIGLLAFKTGKTFELPPIPQHILKHLS